MTKRDYCMWACIYRQDGDRMRTWLRRMAEAMSRCQKERTAKATRMTLL